MSTSEKISVMQAFEDGKTIEYRIFGRDCWTEAKEPCWNWAYCEYRIKRAPKYFKAKYYEKLTDEFCYDVVEIKALDDALKMLEARTFQFTKAEYEIYSQLKELVKK